MNDVQPQNLVLSIYPFSRGFAFVFFEGPESLFDWGVKEIKEKHKNPRTLDEIKKLIDQYRPEVLVIEDTSGKLRCHAGQQITASGVLYATDARAWIAVTDYSCQ